MAEERPVDAREAPQGVELQPREAGARDGLLHVCVADQASATLALEPGQDEAHARLIQLAPAMLWAGEGLVDEDTLRGELALDVRRHVQVARIDPHAEDHPALVQAQHRVMPELQARHALGALAGVELGVQLLAGLDVGRLGEAKLVALGCLEARVLCAHRAQEHVEGVDREAAAHASEKTSRAQ